MAWYEITTPGVKPFVIPAEDLNIFNQDKENKIKLLLFAPLNETKDMDVLAEVIHLGDDWAELHEEDKDFSLESARRVLAKFRVFPK